MLNNNLKRGFTLVELIIVMSIISLLVTLGIVSYRSAQIRAKDTAVRKSDLKQYQTALEIFAGDNGTLYPHYASPVRANSLCPDINLQGCPEDPRPDSAQDYYMYASVGSGEPGSITGTAYILFAHFEEKDEYWVVCSDGRSGVATVQPTTGVCPL